MSERTLHRNVRVLLATAVLVTAPGSGAARADDPDGPVSGAQASVGVFYGIAPAERLRLDGGFQLTYARTEWPAQLEARLGGGSRSLDADGLFLMELGARRTFGNGRARPFAGAGLGFIAPKFDDGTPLGYWARGGLNLRVLRSLFVEPYVGYGSYGGPGFAPSADRLSVGIVWLGFFLNRDPAPVRSP